jgi:hypothetical protein
MALFGGACATGQLDRPFADGQYLEVVRLFEADSTLHGDEMALYQVSLAYGLPTSPAFDAERAVETLDRLLSLYPRSSRASEARHLRDILSETARLQAERSADQRRLNEATMALEAARGWRSELSESLALQRVRADGLQTIADQLTRQLQSRDARIQALEEELAALKEIDLNRPPPIEAPAASGTGDSRP